MFDPQLVLEAQQGDKAAWEALVVQSMPALLAWSRHGIPDPQEAEDVAQETLLEAYLALSHLREPAAWWSWLRCIVFKQADRVRRRKKVATLPLTSDLAVSNMQQTEHIMLARETTDYLHAAINTLSSDQQTVVRLFYGQGYSYIEIAQLLDIPVSTVRKRLYHARQQLRGSSEVQVIVHTQTNQSLPQTLHFLIAVYIGHTPRVQELLQLDPALAQLRIEHHWSELAKLLLPPATGETALHLAARTGQREIGQMLIHHGALVDAQTPLHTAVLYNQPLLAALLLRHKAPVDAQLSNGMTALHWAALRGRNELITLLEAHGADWHLPDIHGRSPHNWLLLRSTP